MKKFIFGSFIVCAVVLTGFAFKSHSSAVAAGDPVQPDSIVAAGDPVQPDVMVAAGDPVQPDCIKFLAGDPVQPD